MVLKKGQLKLSSGTSSAVSVEPCALMTRHPTLWSFLTQTTWEDGSCRVTGTLTLTVWDGQLRLCLNDRESECSAFICGRSVTALLKAAEEAMEEGKVEFRPNPWASRGARRKKG